jgi:hypothetical protein
MGEHEEMQEMTTTAARPATQYLDAVAGTGTPLPVATPQPTPQPPEDIAAQVIATLRRSGYFRAWRVCDHTLPAAAIVAEMFHGDALLAATAATDDPPSSGP